jgi:hypothetical protein
VISPVYIIIREFEDDPAIIGKSMEIRVSNDLAKPTYDKFIVMANPDSIENKAKMFDSLVELIAGAQNSER